MNEPPAGSRAATTIDAILSAASDETRQTLRVLGELLGHRDGSGHNSSLADFLSALDGVRQRKDILTIADSGRWQAAVDRGRYLAPPPPRRRNRAKGVDA